MRYIRVGGLGWRWKGWRVKIINEFLVGSRLMSYTLNLKASLNAGKLNFDRVYTYLIVFAFLVTSILHILEKNTQHYKLDTSLMHLSSSNAEAVPPAPFRLSHLTAPAT